MRIALVSSIFASFLFFLIFLLSAVSNLGYILASLFIILFILSLYFSLKIQSDGSNFKRFSRVKFFIFLFPILALIFSSGYLARYTSSFLAISPSYEGFFSLSIILPEFSVLCLIAEETATRVKIPMIRAGYDSHEVETEMKKFTNHIISIGAVSLFISAGFIFLLIITPEIDIGIFPAIIIFIIVYMAVIFNFLRKNA